MLLKDTIKVCGYEAIEKYNGKTGLIILKFCIKKEWLNYFGYFNVCQDYMDFKISKYIIQNDTFQFKIAIALKPHTEWKSTKILKKMFEGFVPDSQLD